MDGYEDLFSSPDKRPGKRKGSVAATPASKISQQMAAVVSFSLEILLSILYLRTFRCLEA